MPTSYQEWLINNGQKNSPESFISFFRNWDFQLPSLNDFDLSLIDDISNKISELYKKKIHLVPTEIYYYPMWYRNNDTWITKEQWILLGKELLEKGGTDVALEILLYFGEEGYKQEAITYLKQLLEAGGFDYDFDLMCLVYPDCEEIRKYGEEDDLISVYKTQKMLKKAGCEPAYQVLARSFKEFLLKSEFFFNANIIKILGKELSREYISEDELLTFKNQLKDIAGKTLDNSGKAGWEELNTYYENIVECAAIMEWLDLAETLKENPEYLHRIFMASLIKISISESKEFKNNEDLYNFYLGCKDWTLSLLNWSWISPKDPYIGSLAAQAIMFDTNDHNTNGGHNLMNIYDKSLSAAIAWKRYRDSQ
jgi:hypothetical protein